MTRVLLIYPFFKPPRDRSVFRFPPLGLGYLASALRQAGHAVDLIDCTFLDRSTALSQAKEVHAEIVGIYCMVSLEADCFMFARALRPQTRLLVAGGPLPTCSPEEFLDLFDVVAQGEAEQTMLEVVTAFAENRSFEQVDGIAYRHRIAGPGDGKVIFTPSRKFTRDLDGIPFPARDLLPNASYIAHGRRKNGYSITTIMSTRGCPYRCEFCSNVVFGGSYRERSSENVVDEIAQALALGYDRISFADDVFTMKKERVIQICREIRRRGLAFKWECLGRVDALDLITALEMKEAGCERIFFGIESGDEAMLGRMNKRITLEEARTAVEAAHQADLQVGAFFIIGYPGDTDETVLKTLHFSTLLPLDYLGLSMPYPLPGTALHERVKDRIIRGWRADESPFGSHVLIFDADFSETKIWFGIMKGHAQFWIKKRLGRLSPLILPPFEKVTDGLFKALK